MYTLIKLPINSYLLFYDYFLCHTRELINEKYLNMCEINNVKISNERVWT